MKNGCLKQRIILSQQNIFLNEIKLFSTYLVIKSVEIMKESQYVDIFHESLSVICEKYKKGNFVAKMKQESNQ